MKILVFCLLGIASLSMALPVPGEVDDEEKLAMVVFSDGTSLEDIEHIVQIFTERSFPKFRHYNPSRHLTQQYRYHGPVYNMPHPKAARFLPPQLDAAPQRIMNVGAPMYVNPPWTGERREEPEIDFVPEKNEDEPAKICNIAQEELPGQVAEIFPADESQLSQLEDQSVDESVDEVMAAMPEGIAAESGAVTTDAEMIAPKQEVVASEPESVAADPEVIAAEPTVVEEHEPVHAVAGELEPAVAAKPEAVAVDPEVIATEPEAVAADPEVIATEPEAVASKPVAVAAEPESVATNPEVIAAEPETVAADPEVIATEPEAVASKPVAVAAEPESVATNPEVIAAKYEAIPPKPEAVAANPETVAENEAGYAFPHVESRAEQTVIGDIPKMKSRKKKKYLRIKQRKI